MATLTKALVVPQFGNNNLLIGSGDTAQYVAGPGQPFTINLFEPKGAGAPIDTFPVDLTKIITALGATYPDYIPSPNVCAAVGADLYVAISSNYAVPITNPPPPPAPQTYNPSAAIVQFADYFSGNNTTATILAKNSASLFTDAGAAYTGLAFDGGKTLGGGAVGTGHLYAVVNGQDTSYPGDTIYAFPVPATGTNVTGADGTEISGNNGQAQLSAFGDMAFDAGGNLWVADYNNNSVLAFPNGTLGGTNAFTVVVGGTGPFAVLSTLATPPAAQSYVFASPEGVAFDGAGNLWVGNNNDGYNPDGLHTSLTTLVQITPALQATILAAAVKGGATFTLATGSAPLTTLAEVKSVTPPSGFALYALPTPNPQPNAPFDVPQFGGIQIDTIGNADLSAGTPQYLYVNDEAYTDVRAFDINPFSSTFLASIGTVAAMNATALGLVDAEGQPVVTNPGNGGIALVRASLLIGDTTTDSATGPDTGVEPNTNLPLDSQNNPIFWESVNIGVGTGPAGQPAPALTAPFTNESVITPLPAADSVWVYVNVQNIGCTATTGTERLRVYWASGATTQAWPETWNEITSTTDPTTIVGLAAGEATVVPILWPPNLYPTDPADPSNTHYCLLARIETAPVYPFGMTYWESEITSGTTVNNMYYNVASNAKIAQTNIYWGPMMDIRVPPGGGPRAPKIPIGIKAGNLGPTRSTIRLGFQLIGPTGATLPFDEARLVIRAHRSLSERLMDMASEVIEHLGDALFHIKDPAKGLSHFYLEAKEMLPIDLELTPPPGVANLAFRAMQYDIVDGRAHLVGGQTFVFGKVAGFNA